MTTFSLTKVGRIGSATGPFYYPCVFDTSAITNWPWTLTLVSSPDHAGGGIYMYGSVGDPAVLGNWESYDVGLAAGRFDAFATKPAANPIYNDPDTGDSETPHIVKIGTDFYLTSHDDTGAADYQVTRLAIAEDAPLNFTRIATNSGKVLDLNAAPLTEYPWKSAHSGYFRWGLNPFSGVAYTYVGYGLFGGGDAPHYAIWGSNDAIAWTLISVLDGLIDPSLPTSPSPWVVKITEIDPQSITYAGGGEYVALCPCGNPAYSSDSRYSDLYEIYLGPDGYTLTREPRLVLSRGAASSYDEYEIGQPTTIEYSGTKLCFYQGADSSAGNSLMLATFTLDATVAKPDPILRRNHDKLVYDATGSAALPAWLEVEGNAPVPSATGLNFNTSTSGVKYASDLDPSVKTWIEMSMVFAYRDSAVGFIPRFQVGDTGPGTTANGFLAISYTNAGGTGLGYVELLGRSGAASTQTVISKYALKSDQKKRHHVGIEVDLSAKTANFLGNSNQPKTNLAFPGATIPNPYRPRISQGDATAGANFILEKITLRMTPDAAGIAPTVSSSVVASTTATLTLSEDCIGDGVGLVIKVGGTAIDGVWTRTALNDMVFTRDTGTFGESDVITLDVTDTDLRNEADLVAVQNVTGVDIQAGGSTLLSRGSVWMTTWSKRKR